MVEETEAVVVESKVEPLTESTSGVVSLSEMFEGSAEEAIVTTTAEIIEAKGEVEEKAVEEVTVEAETKAETPTAEQGQLAAMLAERDKRQKAEARIAELEAKIEPEKNVDPIEDPEGYANSLEQKQAASELKTKITLSQSMMTELDPDYVRLEGVFKSLIADDDGSIIDEGLVRKFQQSDNPAKFARDHAKEHESLAAMKDPKYRETLAATIRAEVLAEIAEKSKAGVSASDVPDLTKAGSAGSNTSDPVHPQTIAGMF